MAKITAPFFGLKASGSLGKALVYATWKGIDYVRRYVIPANPKSALQQAQRGYLHSGVDKWHALNLTELDYTSWNRWARYRMKPMSGFNSFVQSFIAVARNVLSWAGLRGIGALNITSTQALVVISSLGNDATLTVPVFGGVSPGYLPNLGNATWNAGTSRYEYTWAGLSTKVNYFLRFGASKAGYEGYSGLHTFITL